MQLEERTKKLELDLLQVKKVANILTKQVQQLIIQNTKFKNTIHQQKLDLETLKRKP
jgi:hypothetical protein